MRVVHWTYPFFYQLLLDLLFYGMCYHIERLCVLKINHYILTSHWCRHCGVGRVIQLINGGPSGGGNPSFHCTHCEQRSSGMDCEPLCYCGWDQHHSGMEYRCLEANTNKPEGWKLWTKSYNKEILKRYL